MTFTRAAAIVSGGALLIAWFAAGNAPDQDTGLVRDGAQSTATSGPGSLAAEVEQQAVRLRERLAQAPVPDVQPRNPFSFAPTRARRMAAMPGGTVHAANVITDSPPVAPPPALVLMGIAEEPSREGIHRTAIIGGTGDTVYIVKEGEPFADRYKVKTIGVDAIELEDTVTSGLRRLALR
jgi:hypothetical protein